MVVSLGTGRVPVEAIDVPDVYRPTHISDWIEIVNIASAVKHLADLFIDQVVTQISVSVPLSIDW